MAGVDEMIKDKLAIAAMHPNADRDSIDFAHKAISGLVEKWAVAKDIAAVREASLGAGISLTGKNPDMNDLGLVGGSTGKGNQIS